MRTLSKYNSFFKIGAFFKKFPLKILKFKRPKWDAFKKKVNINLQQKKITSNAQSFFKLKKVFKSWVKKKKILQNAKVTKKVISCLFNNGIKHKNIYKNVKGNNNRLSLTINFIFKQLYRIDILLYQLSVCRSHYQSKQLIYSKKVYLNNVLLMSPKKFLKQGDIITFKNVELGIFNTKLISNKYSKSIDIISFLEFEPYTNSFIIIKRAEALSFQDINLKNTEFIDIKKYSIS